MPLDLDVVALLVGAFAFFVGALVKGVTGMGMPLVAIPIMAIVMPVSLAVPITVVPGIVTNIWQIHQARRHRSRLGRVLPLALAIIVGTTIGAWLISIAEPRILSAVLGFVLLAFVALSAIDVQMRVRDGMETPASLAAGGTTGVIGGMTGAFGPTLAIYLLALRLGKNEFIWLMGVMMLVCSLTLGLALTGFGGFGPGELVLSIAALLPAWLGLRAGAYVREIVSPRTFRRAVLVVILVMALTHVAKAAGW